MTALVGTVERPARLPKSERCRCGGALWGNYFDADGNGVSDDTQGEYLHCCESCGRYYR